MKRLALLGGAIALVLVSCGGESKPLSNAEYVKKANAICEAAEERGQRLEDRFADAEEPEELAEGLGAATQLLESMSNELKKLKPPENDQEDVEEILENLDKSVAELDDVTQAIREADDEEEAFGALFEIDSEPFNDFVESANDYELDECANTLDDFSGADEDEEEFEDDFEEFEDEEEDFEFDEEKSSGDLISDAVSTLDSYYFENDVFTADPDELSSYTFGDAEFVTSLEGLLPGQVFVSVSADGQVATVATPDEEGGCAWARVLGSGDFSYASGGCDQEPEF